MTFGYRINAYTGCDLQVSNRHAKNFAIGRLNVFSRCRSRDEMFRRDFACNVCYALRELRTKVAAVFAAIWACGLVRTLREVGSVNGRHFLKDKRYRRLLRYCPRRARMIKSYFVAPGVGFSHQRSAKVLRRTTRRLRTRATLLRNSTFLTPLLLVYALHDRMMEQRSQRRRVWLGMQLTAL
jgi:hypothetical protein